MNLAINMKVHHSIYSFCRTVSTKTNKKTKWKSVVGLEIHSQIASASKLFSGAATEFGSPVNSNVALFDASIPGTLPVLNKRCVDAAIKTALALNCRINQTSMFDRKHYFYADLPSGFQITQQRQAIAVEGTFKFPVFVPGVTKKPYEKTVRLFQLQLEQDSGKSLHDDYQKVSLVDLNRAGVPLMELVFAPDLTDGEEAAGLVKELILILTRLGTCSCKMEEGALRVDANISLHREGEPLGVRTEVKNIGSVRGVAQAIAYEIQRQTEVLNAGGRIFNETRQWDAERKATVAMRDKEVVQDYRFMPEPNLPPLRVDTQTIDALRQLLPELPQKTRDCLTQDHGLSQEIAIILVNESSLLQHFLNVCHDNPRRPRKMITNLLINDLLSCCHKNKLTVAECKITSEQLGELVDMLVARTISLQMAKMILQEMVESSEVALSPQAIANAKNWKLITDPVEVEKLCTEVIENNPKLVAQYRKGKGKLLFALAGDIAKQTDNRVDMEMVVDILKKMLKA